MSSSHGHEPAKTPAKQPAAIQKKPRPPVPKQPSPIWRALATRVPPGVDVAPANDPGEKRAEQLADAVIQPNGLFKTPDTTSTNDWPMSSVSPPEGLGTGQTLDGGLQNYFEGRLGRSLDHIRIHTDQAAADMSASINAQAFSFGNHIAFGKGEFAPENQEGKHLIAHELGHALESPSRAQSTLFRKVTEPDVDAEFSKWCDDNKRIKDKTHKEFPWSAWDFIRPQIQDNQMKALPKPADKAGQQKWEDNFTKAEIIGGWLANLKSTTTSDAVKEDAESKIYFIADTMVQAGLISKGMAQAANTDDSQKELIYTQVLNNPSGATAAELTTIFKFQTNGKTDPNGVPFIETLCSSDGNSLQKMDTARTRAMFEHMQTTYPNHEKIVEAMAATLIFNPGVRTSIADEMMKGTLGTPELLFQILQHPYFKDPEYDGAMLINTPNQDVDKDTEKHWKDDMPFAYKYKQQYYVTYLIGLAKKHAIDIKPPADHKIATLQAWLDTNTENIGQAAAKEYPTNNDAIFAIYNNIADIFFYHTDKNVTPDNQGKLSKLGTGGKPDKMRIEADCDVFATYAMRLHASAGYETIGYMGLYPQGNFVGRDAHAAALIRKNGAYFVINNKGVYDSGITEAKTDENKQDAITEMKSIAIDQTYGDPKPTQWNIYYADALAKGALPADFLSKPQTYRRTDLE